MARKLSISDKKQIVEEKKKMILRDLLAVDRTKMANQRTLMAFVRTGLYLWVSAIAVLRMAALQELYFIWPILVLLGFIMMVMGFINYARMRKKINRAYTGL